MNCSSFGKCGSCTLYEDSYHEGLAKKVEATLNLFVNLYNPNIDIIESVSSKFRFRSEFRIWHDNNTIYYAMNGFNKEIVLIDSCEIVSEHIYKLMPIILDELKTDNLLTTKLFSIEFLSTKTGDMLVTLIYHKKLEDDWIAKAKELEDKLSIKIIGRSKKQKIILSDDRVYETLFIDKEYKYSFYENGFTQPNVLVNEQMIKWVQNNVDNTQDLLELYCGAGNFTIPLSSSFNNILATEIAKISIKSAKNNLELNHINNVKFVRVSSEEMTQAYDKVRVFNRFGDINLDDYKFSHIFVDPPRAGLDDVTINLVKRFDNIIYISCNPVTLKRDLEILTLSHEIVNFALFDQFAYTNHIESGVILRKQKLKE